MVRLRLPKLPSDLSTEQKAASVILIFLGLGGIILGFLSFGANIRRPFEEQLAAAPKGFLFDSEKEAKALEASKTQDTDGDGLSDYDEIYVFKTSPYLADTDSDGIDDKTEVYAGTDPNCPKDRECGNVISSPEATGSAAQSTVAAPPVSEGAESTFGLTPGAGGFETEADVAAYLKALDTNQIRTVLTQSGVTADQLEGLTDAEVKDLFIKAVDQALQEGRFKAFVTTTTTP